MASGRKDWTVWIIVGVVGVAVIVVAVLALTDPRTADEVAQPQQGPANPVAPIVVAQPALPKDDPNLFAEPVTISNVRAKITLVALTKVDAGISRERVGEPAWNVIVEFTPVNGRKSYEFWDSFYNEAGEPSLWVGKSRYVMLGSRMSGSLGKKKVSTPEKPEKTLVQFEAIPDPVEELRILIPTQLPGHQFEHFEFVVPGRKVFREKWDNRPGK